MSKQFNDAVENKVIDVITKNNFRSRRYVSFICLNAENTSVLYVLVPVKT